VESYTLYTRSLVLEIISIGGSNPSSPTKNKRVSYNGGESHIIGAFQASDVGSIPTIRSKNKNKMSNYANNFIMNEETGLPKLIKHLNQDRIDRGGWNSTPGGWNKSGKRGRMNKERKSELISSRRSWKLKCKKLIYDI
jgi:hypothetical protein